MHCLTRAAVRPTLRGEIRIHIYTCRSALRSRDFQREKWARVQTHLRRKKIAKRFLVFLVTSILLAAPMPMAQDSDHVEGGALVDYFRLSNNAAPGRNFLGVGGREHSTSILLFNKKPRWLMTSSGITPNTFSNGITGETVHSNFRALHGFFGPKFPNGVGGISSLRYGPSWIRQFQH